MLKNLLTILLLLLYASTYAADSDTAKEDYRSYAGIRTEIGWNEPWYASLGFSYHMHMTQYGGTHGMAIASMVYYLSGDVHFGTANKGGQTFYGYKTGVEFTLNGLLAGVEIKGLTDFSSGIIQTYCTPKVGFGFGYINLHYGYNTFRDAKNTYAIGRHQVALSINFSPKMIKELKNEK
ncbi:MAG: hypothetical protein J0L80_17090 [Chitinophagales bacterium]|nr:hypothetical protein [Chitinophagales bacterium]